jgi:hypothetical protein
MTPMMEAVFWDKEKYVKLMLTKHPNVMLKDIRGRTVTQIAQARNSLKCFGLIKNYIN